MLKPEFTGQFKKDYKLALKRGCDPSKLEEVVSLLCSEKMLPEKYRDHPLANSKNYKNVRECHIEPVRSFPAENPPLVSQLFWVPIGFSYIRW